MFLSTHADRQGVDIVFTVCLRVYVCVCVFVWLRIPLLTIKLAASKFAWRFIRVQGRESQMFVNFAPPEAQKQTNRLARGPRPPGCKHYHTHEPVLPNCFGLCSHFLLLILNVQFAVVCRLYCLSAARHVSHM